MADTREIWVDIKNYEGKYRISNLGRVKSLEWQVSHDGITWIQPERIMCHWCGTTSLYDCVRLYKGGVGKKFSVHRLVAFPARLESGTGGEPYRREPRQQPCG